MTIKKFVTATNFFLIFLSLLAVIKSLFIGFDIDEGYAIAQSYRLVIGDNMFSEMWEPHQMSAFASSLFMLPFLLITGGSSTGIVLYLRIIGSVIHLLIGYAFFRTARKKFNLTISLLITLIHINFLPKWLTLPEFEVMVYWATCVLFLALLAWYENKKKIHLIVAGASLFVTLMCYPTMILLYPVYVIAIWTLNKGTCKENINAVFWFTLPNIIIGVSFLLYLFSYMSVPEFIENLNYVMSDESHSNSLTYRFTGYLREIGSFAGQLLWCLLLATPITICIWKFTSMKNHIKCNGKSILVILHLLLTIAFFCIAHIWESFLGDANQFYLYFRFLLIAILGIVAYCLCKEKNHPYLLLGVIPGLVAVIASALITNMSFEIALARIYIAVMATGFILGTILNEKYAENKILKSLIFCITVIFILGLLVCKLLLVRVTGCIPISVKMHMGLVTDGPVAGILVKDDLAVKFNSDIPAIMENTDGNDKLLYFGCENIYYLASDAELATPSVQGTAVFNQQYIDYFEKNPDKLPNVVILDKSFTVNPYYNYQEQNRIVLDWINEEFKDAVVIETDYLTILRK